MINEFKIQTPRGEITIPINVKIEGNQDVSYEISFWDLRKVIGFLSQNEILDFGRPTKIINYTEGEIHINTYHGAEIK